MVSGQPVLGLPPFTGTALVSQAALDPVLGVLLLAAAGLYLTGVYRLRVRGDRWPVLRTLLFLVPGLGSVALVTMSGLGAYDDSLLSVHMIQHMVLGMIAPIFLALGAPVTLALRTLPARWRRRLAAALHSRVARVLAFPLYSYAVFVANPFILYFTGLYKLTMQNDWAHEAVHMHFLLVGCLFFWPLIGLDPLPGRWPYPARALLMLLSTPFHAVLGLTIMQSHALIGGDWYPSLRLSWVNPHDDQVLGGGILWAGGEVVSITMIAVLVAQWMRAADKEARRIDRHLDRAAVAATRPAARPGPGPAGPAQPAADPAGVAVDDPVWEVPWWERGRPAGRPGTG